MNIIESSPQNSVRQTMEQIEVSLTRVLHGQEVNFQDFYHLIYVIYQNDHGTLIQNLNACKIQEVFEAKLKSVAKGEKSLNNISDTLKGMLETVETLMRFYFFFEEMYYEAEKNTSLKVIAYNIIKELLVKEDDLFVELLSELSILMFKDKSGTASQPQKELMAKTIQIITKLDNYPSKIHIFNHYLKDLYIKNMATDNRLRIQKLKDNYNPKEYFTAMKNYYQTEYDFVHKHFKSKKTELTLNDIVRCFYSNWISENWSFLFADSELLQKVLNEDFLVVYEAVKLDDAGLKQFLIWYTELLSYKLKGLKITNNESLIEEFSKLYKSTARSLEVGVDGLFVNKVKITFENWLNNDSIDIANRLNNHINSIIVASFQNWGPVPDFVEKLANPMIVFKFTKDKDLFQLAYGKALVERMVTSRYSRTLEQATLKLFKDECGQSWTDRITAIMDQNMSSSTTQSSIQSENPIVTINQLQWFSLTVKEPHVNDQSMILLQKNNGALEGKQAKWLLNYGNGLLRMHLGKSFDLWTSTRGMQLLAYFNNNSTLKLKEYLKQGQYDFNVFKNTVICLLKSKILLSNTEITDFKSIKSDIILSLNLNFSPQSETIKVFEQKDMQELCLARKQQLTEDRKLIIEGIITKLIKRQKVGQKDKLIEEALEIIDKKGFSASRTLVEDCFVPLEDRGYIKLVENQVTYLP